MPKFTFQWFFDLSTKPDVMQKITVAAGGHDVVSRLAPQFAAYKYFKLGKIKLSMTPASTLPVDPTGLSYEAGESTVDPRDQLTPGLVRITNGECVGNLPSLTGEAMHKFYNQMILDRRWFKFSMQSGLKKSAIPLFWSVGMGKQWPYPGSNINIPVRTRVYEGSSLIEDGVNSGNIDYKGNSETSIPEEPQNRLLQSIDYDHASDFALMQLGHNAKLGWLPTDVFLTANGKTDASVADVPKVDCFTVLLPPAYKTKYYFRCYVTETVFFKEPVTNYFVGGAPYKSLDRFVAPGVLQQSMPEVAGVPTEPKMKISR